MTRWAYVDGNSLMPMPGPGRVTPTQILDAGFDAVVIKRDPTRLKTAVKLCRDGGIKLVAVAFDWQPPDPADARYRKIVFSDGHVSKRVLCPFDPVRAKEVRKIIWLCQAANPDVIIVDLEPYARRNDTWDSELAQYRWPYQAACWCDDCRRYLRTLIAERDYQYCRMWLDDLLTGQIPFGVYPESSGAIWSVKLLSYLPRIHYVFGSMTQEKPLFDNIRPPTPGVTYVAGLTTRCYPPLLLESSLREAEHRRISTWIHTMSLATPEQWVAIKRAFAKG